MPSLEERRAETAGAVGAEVVDVEAAVVVVARAQEQIVSALVVVAQEQTRKRLLIKLSSSSLTFFENLPTYSEVSNKHGVFLILFEKKFPTTCLIRISTFI